MGKQDRTANSLKRRLDAKPPIGSNRIFLGTLRKYKFKYVGMNPNILGGVPHILGTQVPVIIVLRALRMKGPYTIQALYPELSDEAVEEVLIFCELALDQIPV